MGGELPEDIPDFEHEARLTLEDLDIQPFWETEQVHAFDCGNEDLNDFLSTEEVRRYEQEMVGKTYLVFHKGRLVGFFTVSQGGLRIEYLRKWKSFSRMSEMKLEAIPALVIGRLAVDGGHQGRGIGRALIKYIAGMAIETQGKMGVRLLILQAKPESIEFYMKCGFQLTVPTARERKRKNRTMFFDLSSIDEIA